MIGKVKTIGKEFNLWQHQLSDLMMQSSYVTILFLDKLS